MGQNVASFTDAWIETQKKVFDEMEKRSHLLQMRGLKQRGDYLSNCLHYVASFTDAWIETGALPVSPGFSFVASFTDAWIET